MCTMSRRLLGIKEEGGASYKTWVGYKLSVGAAPDAHQTSARKTMFARRCPPQLQQGRCLGSCMPSRSSSSAGTRRGAPQRFSRRISALGDVEDLTLSSDLCLLWPLGVPGWSAARTPAAAAATAATAVTAAGPLARGRRGLGGGAPAAAPTEVAGLAASTEEAASTTPQGRGSEAVVFLNVRPPPTARSAPGRQGAGKGREKNGETGHKKVEKGELGECARNEMLRRAAACQWQPQKSSRESDPLKIKTSAPFARCSTAAHTGSRRWHLCFVSRAQPSLTAWHRL